MVGVFEPAGLRDHTLNPVDDTAPLEHWEAWCRASVIDSELLQGLRYGKLANGFEVKAPSMPIATILRPPADAVSMRRQLELVCEYAELRSDRAAEILSQVPQVLSYWTSVVGLHVSRTRWTLELLAATVRLAIAVEMRIKHALAFPRPVQYSPQVQPMILTPQHSAYPSGHSTEAHAAATLLVYLAAPLAPAVLQKQLKEHWKKRLETPPPAPDHATVLATKLYKLASRIAINRTVAGVHFPIDSRAGQALGMSLGEYVVARCTGTAVCQHRLFDPSGSMGEDFVGPPVHQAFGSDKAMGMTVEAPKGPSAPGQLKPETDALAWLWAKAKAEWV